MRLCKLKQIILCLVISFFSLTVTASDVIAWEDLTAEKQTILAPIKNDWSELPAKRQKRLNEFTKPVSYTHLRAHET